MKKSILDKIKSNETTVIIPIFLTIYFVMHLFLLTKFPFVHSDESWLSGFSRHVLEQGTFKTSEPFFIEYPRAIHGLRIVFSSIQIIFIKLFGYSIFSMRLISLIASTFTLWVISEILKKLKFSVFNTLFILIVLSVNIQFIYTSHMARQEILILFLMMCCVLVNIKKIRPLLTGIIISIGIGIHPNSLLIALGIGAYYLYKALVKEIPLKQLFLLIGTTALGAVFFIIISFYLNINFIKDYLSFGESLGVVNFDHGRLEGYYWYFVKLFKQISGTYQVFPIQLSIITMFLSIPFGIHAMIKKKTASIFFIFLLSMHIGLIVIGRYNQTAIIFPIVFNILFWLTYINKKFLITLSAVILLYQCYNTMAIITQNHDNYNDLKTHLNLDGKILGNLNLDYHLDHGQLIDYRNLWYIDDFESYIEKHDIDYIIVPEEMGYIYQTRPKWDILYGSLPYYENMVAYLETCTLVDSFTSKTYGMRIARYIDTYPWTIKIYKTK